MRASYKKALLAIFGTVLSVLVMFSFMILHTEHVARHFVADYLTLKVGQSTYAETVKTLGKFSKHSHSFPRDCENECSFEFHFENRELYYTHLAPDTGFEAVLEFRNGLLIHSSLTYGMGILHVVEVTEGSGSFRTRAISPGLEFSFYSNLAPEGFKIQVKPNATPQERAMAYGLD